MPEPNEPQRSAHADERPSLADQRRWQNQLTRDVQTSRMFGRSVRFPGPGAADAGEQGIASKAGDAGLKAASTGGQAAGAGMQAAGKGMEAAGKGVQAAGKGVQAGGNALIQAGAGLSSTGVGAIAGVPLAIAGGGLVAGGAGMQAGGAGMQAAGKGTAAAGKGVRSAAKGVGKFQQARDRSRQIRSMMRGGGGANLGGMQAIAKGGGTMPMGGGGALGSMGQAKDMLKGGPSAAMEQAMLAKKMLSPMGKLQMAKEGTQMAKQLLKDKKLRWKLISKALLGSGGIVIAVLILLAPLISLAFVLMSIAMDFKISGKEWLLMAGLNMGFALIMVSTIAQIGIMMCMLDPTCVGEAVIDAVL